MMLWGNLEGNDDASLISYQRMTEIIFMGDLRSIKAKLRGQPCGNNLKAMKSR